KRSPRRAARNRQSTGACSSRRKGRRKAEICFSFEYSQANVRFVVEAPTDLTQGAHHGVLCVPDERSRSRRIQRRVRAVAPCAGLRGLVGRGTATNGLSRELLRGRSSSSLRVPRTPPAVPVRGVETSRA